MPGRPIVECMYGWGQVLRLHRDHLEVNGIFYRLDELLSIRPVYRRALGVSSVRLELHFQRKALILRGIAVIDSSQKLIEYLTERCTIHQEVTLDAVQIVQPPEKLTRTPPQASSFLPTITSYESLQEYAQAPTIPVEVPQPRPQPVERTKRLRKERLLREHGFDVEQVERLLQAENLPQVQVPVRLMPEECAHYRTEATLSGEPLINTPRYRYRVKDQGMLIFTNKRIIYLGRKCQIVLGYARLLHVSRLQGAIAFLAEHWTRREIFEVRHPLECAMYLECILKRFQIQDALPPQIPRSMPAAPQQHDDISESETVLLTQDRWNLSATPLAQITIDLSRVGELEQ